METSLDGSFEDFDSFCGDSLIYKPIETNSPITSTGTIFSGEDSETHSTQFIKYSIEISDKITEKRCKFPQRTSTTGLIDFPIPKPIPLIQGLGAIEFKKELENLEYSDEIKEFYKGSRELVKKLKIL